MFVCKHKLPKTVADSWRTFIKAIHLKMLLENKIITNLICK